MPWSVYAQSALQVRGDSLRLAGSLVGAVQAYTAAWQETPGDPALAFALAGTYALHPEYRDPAFQYLDAALHTDSTMRVLWDADFFFLRADPRWAAVEARQLDKLAAQVSGAFDRDYARTLLHLRMREWAFRYHMTLAYRSGGPQSPHAAAYAYLMSQHHAANLAALEPLLAEKGWPQLSAVGPEAAYAAGNVVNHSDLATRERYLPLLKAACEAGEADWSRYAHILDRTELEKGNPQVYGTQMAQNDATGQYEPRPMVDPEGVDARRAAKGIEPLADQLSRFNEAMQRDFGGR